MARRKNSPKKGIRPPVEDAEFLSGERRSNLSTAEAWAASVAEPKETSPVIQLSPLLVDEKTAAELLGVSKRMVYELNESGDLPCKRIGSRKLYSVTRLRKFADGEVN